MSSCFPSPRLLTAVAGLLLMVGIAPAQEEKKADPAKSQKDDLPPPRVVGGAKKDVPPVKDAEIPPKKEAAELKEAPKEEPKKEAAKEEPKKENAKEAPKEEPKKEDAKPDPLVVFKETAEKAGLTGSAGSIAVATQRGDNAWVLTASALVLLMTPGLALFYGGMVRRKNVLATMMQSYASMAIVGLYWVAFGYGLAFGPSQIIAPDALTGLLGDASKGGGIIGWDWKLFFLQGYNSSDYLPGYNIPILSHVMFQGMFAIITPALISGAVAERIRFWPWTIFMILWVTVVYCPLAHMVWAFDWFYADPTVAGKDLGASAVGLLGKLGALDFAGGTVVHIAAGFGGLACMLAIRKRVGYPEHAMHPNSMVLTLIGAGLLWFGWFGFNGGSALNADNLASTAFATTQAAAAAAGLSWVVVEWIFKGKPTALGLASGIVAGLVAVTPASGFVYVWGGALIGIAAGVVCYFAVQVKTLFGYDDSLDAFGVHGIGGFLGAVLTGVFCYAAVQSASADGFFAHRGLDAAKASLQKEADGLKKEIPDIEKTGPDLQKKSEESAKKVEAAKDDKEKDKLQKEADEAKTAFDEVAKKVGRRQSRIAAIEAPKDSKDPDSKGGELVKLQDKVDGYKKDAKGPMTQVWIQIKTCIFSAVFAFALSLALALLVQAITLGNFSTSHEDEQEGLDQTEHGETGFDFVGMDNIPMGTNGEPKAAKIPPGGKRFELVIEGVENGGLMHAWSDLCQPKEGPLDPDFAAVYPYVTTVQGNRFRLRGGDPKALAASVQKLFQKKLGKPLKVRVEE